jgi:hypothetical protein
VVVQRAGGTGLVVKLHRGDTGGRCPTAPSPRDPDSLNLEALPKSVSLKSSACPPRARPLSEPFRTSSLVLAPSDKPLKTSTPFSRNRPDFRARATWAARSLSFLSLLESPVDSCSRKHPFDPPVSSLAAIDCDFSFVGRGSFQQCLARHPSRGVKVSYQRLSLETLALKLTSSRVSLRVSRFFSCALLGLVRIFLRVGNPQFAVSIRRQCAQVERQRGLVLPAAPGIPSPLRPSTPDPKAPTALPDRLLRILVTETPC